METWVFVGQMGAAPGLPSPLTPHRCPNPGRAPLAKERKIAYIPEPTCQCAEQLGAFERHFWLRGGAVITAEMKEERGRAGPCGGLSLKACLTDGSPLNRPVVVIHKLRG